MHRHKGLAERTLRFVWTLVTSEACIKGCGPKTKHRLPFLVSIRCEGKCRGGSKISYWFNINLLDSKYMP
jgi:hypothetical protein